MSYQLSNGAVILGEVTRRSFADGLRFIEIDKSVPSKSDMDIFDDFMKLSGTTTPVF